MEKENMVPIVCLVFVGGIGLASFLSVPIFIYPLLFFLTLIIFFCFQKKSVRNIWPISLIGLFFIFGVWREQISFPKVDENHLVFYNNQKIILTGEITKEPEMENNRIGIILEKISTENKKIKGGVLLNVPLYSYYQRGDILRVECFLVKPKNIGKIDYSEYLAVRGVYSICSWPKIEVLKQGERIGFYDKILIFRNKIQELINKHFTEPQGTFVSAILLGNKNQIPPEIRNWFAQAGISHILAVSGLHISIFSKLITIFFINVLLISRQKIFWPTFLVVIFFVVLVGAPASAVRAAIMGLGLVLSQIIGRPQTGKRFVVYAATAILLINPQLLKSDIGFQLSFLAVAGISFLSTVFDKYFNKIPDFRYFPLRQYLASTISAQIFVLPLVLYYFGNLSLMSPLINVLVISVMPLIMVFGLTFALLGLINFYLAKIFFYPLWLLSTFVILAAKFSVKAPGAYLALNFPLFLTIIFYILIFFWLGKLKKTRFD